MVNICVFVLLLLFQCCKSCNDINECKLQAELDNRSRCSAMLRPVRQRTMPVKVRLELVLVSITTIQEQQQIFQANIWIEVVWNDCSLKWDPGQFGGTDSAVISLKSIWRPDLCFMNDITNDKCIKVQDDEMVLVESNGNVNWWISRQVNTHCDITIDRYPFDEQDCTISIGKWYMTDEKEEIIPKYPYVSMNNYKPSGEWEVLNTSITFDGWVMGSNFTNYTDMYYHIVVRRRSLFYVYYIILPVVLLSVLNVICFFTPIESGEKVGLAVAIFLTFAVFMSTISDSVPKLSNDQFRLGIYMTIEMIVSGLTIIMEIFVLGLYHCPKDKPIGLPYRLLKPKACVCSRERTKSKNRQDSLCDCSDFFFNSNTESLNVWQIIAMRIERLFGTLIAVVNFVSFIVFLVGVNANQD